MRAAWRELMFTDEDQEAKETRDPVAPAQRSAAAQRKASRHQQDDGTPVHSFQTLLADLASVTRNTCRMSHTEGEASTFPVLTIPNATQKRAYELIETTPM